MVSLPQVLTSNARISTSLPRSLVAVFAGATTGIGLATLKAFVTHAVAPRIYLLARNTDAAARVVEACVALNPDAAIEVVKVDLSSIRETDAACAVIKKREQGVNLAVLSQGEVRLDRALTDEGLHHFLTTVYYTRIRIVQNLLPLLTYAAATSPLARVVDVAGGTKEGPVDTADLAVLRVPFAKIRGQLTSMHTLALESLAAQAPTVSFVQDFPGQVVTPLFDDVPGWIGVAMRIVMVCAKVFERWLCVPIEECGERHVFMGTSAKYAPGEGTAVGVALGEGVEASQPTEKILRSVYSIDWHGEGPGKQVMELLEGLRKKGVREAVWEHTNGEFERIKEM